MARLGQLRPIFGQIRPAAQVPIGLGLDALSRESSLVLFRGPPSGGAGCAGGIDSRRLQNRSGYRARRAILGAHSDAPLGAQEEVYMARIPPRVRDSLVSIRIFAPRGGAGLAHALVTWLLPAPRC